jgi:hypothetical protein
MYSTQGVTSSRNRRSKSGGCDQNQTVTYHGSISFESFEDGERICFLHRETYGVSSP